MDDDKTARSTGIQVRASTPAGTQGGQDSGGLITVGGGDEDVAKIQLAARWAEGFRPAGEDSLEAMLRRFYRAYSYIDSVTHGIAPDELP